MMAIEITERHTVIQGMPVVKLSDDHFWFGKPVSFSSSSISHHFRSVGSERTLPTSMMLA
jgi:hypothetical protein